MIQVVQNHDPVRLVDQIAMTSLPIPFVTAFLLVLLAASNHQQLSRTATGRIFALVLYINAVSMLCIGFRWSLELLWLLPIAAALALSSAALLVLAFSSLGRTGPVIEFSRDWPHVIPLLLLVLILLIEPRWIDYLLIVVKLFYAGVLIYLAKQGPSSLQLVRLNWLSNSHQALWASAILLILSAAIDSAIAIDFALYDGQHAASMVGAANLFVVLLLGWAAVMAGRAKGSDSQFSTRNENSQASQPEPMTLSDERSDEDPELFEQLNQLLIQQRLFADTELNLQKLSRKAGVPARTVSRAINKHAGANVSQWINAARIDAACDMLKDSNISVTQAMLDSGFLTKSNFNREFKRLKGSSPSQWRAKH